MLSALCDFLYLVLKYVPEVALDGLVDELAQMVHVSKYLIVVTIFLAAKLVIYNDGLILSHHDAVGSACYDEAFVVA